LAGSDATVGAGASALARAHAALLRDSDLQFSLPAFQEPKVPDWLQALGQVIRAIAPVFPYIFYAGLFAGVVAILFFIIRELIGWRFPALRRPKTVVLTEAEWRPAPERVRVLLEDADRLAAEGRYGEAAHLILFRSIEDIDGRWPNLVRPALTSRDIAAHRGLPDRARQTFGDIARVVEHAVFGGRALSAEDFAHCRSAYEMLARPGAAA
jgi:hypothetical protein